MVELLGRVNLMNVGGHVGFDGLGIGWHMCRAHKLVVVFFVNDIIGELWHKQLIVR